MRIFGGHDYYDGAASLGRDPDVIFKRQPFKMDRMDVPISFSDLAFHAWNPIIRADETKSNWNHRSTWREWCFDVRGRHYRVDFYTVLFCGKLYGIACGMQVGVSDPGAVWFHSIEAMDQWLGPLDIRINDIKDSWPKWRQRRTKRDAVIEHFEVRDVYDLEWVIEKRAVLGHVKHHGRAEGEWTFNDDGLGKLDFARAVPPYQAWQELSMFVGSTIPREGAEMVQITDDRVKAAKHGFDKWSFRKKVR